ncbi:Tetrapyrrole-binding protein [Actinidia chinensis var. chinensis]|uniref:Tetrapyrrole-binding protein n=1 Tax=Actinidia chinensis var. chinensis TaxID=1590841 RepID=A0A2R6S0Q9_ACTCC|nr:Tetrapyrrole-binding protein [Actinidia chinensis var. chinensis]
MATKSLQSLHHHHRHSFLKCHPIDSHPTTVFLKPATITTTISLSQSLSFTSFSLSSSSSITTTTSQSTSLDLLQHHLSSQNFRQADEETRRLLIALTGESAQKRGYVFFSEVQFIPENDLKAIDNLWREHSNNRFGYSVQKKIWNKVNRDFSRFFLKVGWMKKLETEVEQYNYRAFPTEFMWELSESPPPPEGHLPLTNALRGTQLLNSILTHAAFEDEEEDIEEEGEGREIGEDKGSENGKFIPKPLAKVFKTDYSF